MARGDVTGPVNGTVSGSNTTGGGFQWGSLGSGFSIGSSIGAAVGSVYSAWSMGKSLRYQLKTQEEIAKINVRVAQLGKESALQSGETQTAQISHRAGQLIAKQRVANAANGVKGGVGSAAEVETSARIMKEIDKLTVEENALAAAWGHKQAGINQLMLAYQRNGDASVTAQNTNSQALGTLMGSIGDVSDRWLKYRSDK